MQLDVWSEYFIGLKLKMSVFIALCVTSRATSSSLTHPAPVFSGWKRQIDHFSVSKCLSSPRLDIFQWIHIIIFRRVFSVLFQQHTLRGKGRSSAAGAAIVPILSREHHSFPPLQLHSFPGWHQLRHLHWVTVCSATKPILLSYSDEQQLV